MHESYRMVKSPLVLRRASCGPHRLLRRVPVFQFSQGIGVFAVEVLAHLQLANADCIGGQLRRRELEPPNPELRPLARPTTPRERHRRQVVCSLHPRFLLHFQRRHCVPAKPVIAMLRVRFCLVVV